MKMRERLVASWYLHDELCPEERRVTTLAMPATARPAENGRGALVWQAAIRKLTANPMSSDASASRG